MSITRTLCITGLTVGLTALAGTAIAQNAATAPVRGPVPYGAPVQSRVQQWYHDTGWQPGYSAVQPYAYGYGYGGAGYPPATVIAPPHEPIRDAERRWTGPQVTRSMPFGYVVDGFGRYPWQRAAYGAAYAPADLPPAPVPVPSPVAPPPPPPVASDSGYFAVPPSQTEHPYVQEQGERG